MKQDKQSKNWIIDAVLFGGFVLALWLEFTGLAVHQWLGLAVIGLAGYHLAAHWTWVKAVTSRFFGRTSTQARRFYLIDAGLAAGFLTIAASGLTISTWLDLPLANFTLWTNVHVLSSVLTLALLVVKIGAHWRWILSVGRRTLFPAPTQRTGALQAAPATAQMSRRDFVRLMAGVGIITLAAGVNALGGLAETPVEASGTSQAATSPQTQAAGSAESASDSTSNAASFCTVRCPRGCSFPGHCRRYTDSNDNGRCDLGECLS